MTIRKTVTVFAASGVAGRACVDELLAQNLFDVRVLQRKPGQQEKSSSGALLGQEQKETIRGAWRDRGVLVQEVDVTDHVELIAALEGVDYLVSCVPLLATESQYPLIFAAREAGVERFVPSEFGFIYEWEQFWPTPTVHRTMARQKAFIKRMIEMAGLDYTIIPAGLWPEYYMLEPVLVMGDGDEPVAWSTGPDVGRIIPHVLAHPASRNAVCPVAATAWCSWNELLAVREAALGRRVERQYLSAARWREAYAKQPAGMAKALMAIGVAATECPQGMPLWANWNALHLPAFSGMPLEDMFLNVVEPMVEGMEDVNAGRVSIGSETLGRLRQLVAHADT
ncbi:MAG: NmrA family NAD(P)-binding protein [Halioglobus sp.]|nr:NmrA family NAD(P)-binding protein [Halioglobus sp.]